MSFSLSDDSIPDLNKSFVVKALWEQLNPDIWPFSIFNLPLGTFLVGGAVRDAFLNRAYSCDLDLVVPDNAIGVSQSIATELGGKSIILDQSRDVARLFLNGWTIDFAKQIGSSIQEDLLTRDYTINSIAISLDNDPKIYDPSGGISDISKKVLAAVSKKNLLDDPLRTLRGLRLTAELGLTIEPETRRFINNFSEFLPTVKAERIQSEVRKIVELDQSEAVLNLIKEFNFLNTWRNQSNDYLNSIPSLEDCRNLKPSERSVALPLLRLTHLFSDKGLEKLRFSRRYCRRVMILRKWQTLYDAKDFKTLSEEDLLSLHRELGEDLPAITLLLSDFQQRIWLDRWRDTADPLFHPRPPVTGYLLQETLSLPAGPRLGELIRYLSHERAFGRINSEQQAFDFARKWLTHN